MNELIFATYDLLDDLKNSYDFIKLLEIKDVINNKYKTEIKIFDEAKKEYDKINDLGGKYNIDFKTVSQKLSDAKANLYTKEEVILYISLEKKIEIELNNFMDDVISYISPNVKGVKACGSK